MATVGYGCSYNRRADAGAHGAYKLNELARSSAGLFQSMNEWRMVGRMRIGPTVHCCCGGTPQSLAEHCEIRFQSLHQPVPRNDSLSGRLAGKQICVGK